jgi:hypothetical protein
VACIELQELQSKFKERMQKVLETKTISAALLQKARYIGEGNFQNSNSHATEVLHIGIHLHKTIIKREGSKKG